MDRNSTVSRNTRLSFSTAGDETVAVSVKGEIKLLECDPDILERVLNIADKEGTVEGIIQHFAEEFPAEDVLHFLESITEAGLLTVTTKEETEAKQDVPLPVLLGKGKLAQAVQQALKKELVHFPFAPPAKMDNFAEGTVFIVCPEQADFNTLLELNSLFIQHRSSYILCYFDGEQIAVGPSVLPGLTPCLSCYLEHRRTGLEQTMDNHFPWQSLGKLTAAWPLPEGPQWDISASWAAELILSETERLRMGGENPKLSGNQALFTRPSSSAQTTVRFEPISTCPSCHALALDKIHQGRPKHYPPPVQLYPDTPVQYTVGGRRSISHDETRKMLDNCLARMDCRISIQRFQDGPLDNTLHRFSASAESSYDPKRAMLVPKLESRGKGLTQEQAYFSAAFELFERISANYTGGFELIRAPYSEVKDLALNIPSHLGKVFHNGGMDTFHEDAPVDWVWGHSLLDGTPKLVPASMVFLSSTRFQGQFYDNTSGGLAAGGTYEDALLQALFEVIEHDAWMIWQANRVQRPVIELDKNLPEGVEELLERIAAHGLRLVLRDYTTDFGFPVFRAWMVDDQDFSFYGSTGFGASLDPAIALERSISEAYQARDLGVERRISNYGIPVARDLVFEYHSLFNLSYFKTIELNNDPDQARVKYSSFTNQSTESVSKDIKKVLDRIRNVIPDAELMAVNLTKEHINIPVVRVIAGGGVQMNAEPLLSASDRLFNLPVMMGHRDEPLSYDDLYNGAYPH
jgi:bacteriocin biosynthesis cyclodehydratase domain-containing protein